MGVEGHKVLHTHLVQLLQHQGAVQRLTGGALMLAGLIHEGHNHVDALALSGGGSDQTLEVSIVIVRRHVVYLSEQGIGQRVIHHIHQEVDVLAANGLLNRTLRLTGTETGNLRRYNVAVLLVAFKSDGMLMLALPVASPLSKIIVDADSQGLNGLQRNQRKRSNGNSLNEF